MKHQRPSTIRQVQWDEVREQVRQLDHELFVAIEGVSPDAEHQLFEVCYPYGALVVDRNGEFCLPDEQGQLQSIVGGDLSNKTIEQLGYHSPAIACGLILEGEMNLFTESEETALSEKSVFISKVFEQGELFALNRMLDKPHTHQTINLWRMSAGARTPYIMPSITNKSKFTKLMRKFDLQRQAPRSLQAHWSFLSEMHQSPNFPDPWYLKVLFFGKGWFLNQDAVAKKLLRLVFCQRVLEQTKFSRNQFQFDKFNHLDKVLSGLYRKKISYHLVTMLYHMFEAACGHAIAYQIADARSAGPFDSFANILGDDYGLDKDMPIILTPTHFTNVDIDQMIYLSLALPTVELFREKSVNNQGMLNELKELANIVSCVIVENLQAEEKQVNLFNIEKFLYQFYAADADIRGGGLSKSSSIFDDDPRMQQWRTEQLQQTYAYNDFLRACVKICKK